MSARNDGGPAFPVAAEFFSGGDMASPPSYGMSLRDYIAVHEPIDPNESIGRQLAEKLAGRPLPIKADQTYDALEVAMFWADAEAAYRYLRADAMLKARES